MTLFWILAGLMVGAAALFVAVPLFRGASKTHQTSRDELNLTIRQDQLAELQRDLDCGVLSQDQFEQGKLEIERGLLLDTDEAGDGGQATHAVGGRKTALVLAIVVPVFAISLYLDQGNRGAMVPGVAAPVAQQDEAAHEITQDQLAVMVQGLADRMENQPDDAEGWMMLGRSYAVMRQHGKSADAYARAYALIGDHPEVLANYADALAMANGGAFTPESLELIERGLKTDPSHQKSLWLLGTARFEGGDYVAAITLWERLAAQLQDGTDMARNIAGSIAEARSLAGDDAPPVVQRAQATPGDLKRVSGTVYLDPALAAKVPQGGTLFIFAKATKGPPMPLAVKRLAVGEFPVTFSLDETMAMMPALSLAKFPQVMVGARISASGNAISQSGDLQGIIGPITVGSENLQITIAEMIP